MQTESDRLKWLRARGEITSIKEAASRYGIGYEVYKKIEGGTRALTREHAETIATFHKISPGWLMFAEGTPEGRMTIKLAGSISAGQEIVLFDDLAESGRRVDASVSDPDAAAFEVCGDSMFPLARDRDVAFFAPERRDLANLIGRECAVLLEDGRRFFKMLERGSRDGLFDLISYNAEPLRDQEVHSAGLFLGVKRILPARRR